MNLDRSKEQTQMLVLIGIMLGIGYFVVIMYFFKPQIKKAGELKSEIVKIKRKVKKTKMHLKKMDLLDKEIEKSKKKIEDFQMLMPKGDESWSIEQLDQIAKKHGVIIKKIQPELESEGKAYFKEDHRYDTKTISVNVRCGYHTFGEFMNALERSSPFLKITDINVVKGEKPEFMHKINFSVIYLVLKEYE